MQRFRGKVFTPSHSETLAQSHLLLSGDPVSRGSGMWPLFRSQRGAAVGLMTTGWSHGSGKGSRRWRASPGSAGLKGGIPPSELEGISSPRTVMSLQGRSGQQPLA